MRYFSLLVSLWLVPSVLGGCGGNSPGPRGSSEGADGGVADAGPEGGSGHDGGPTPDDAGPTSDDAGPAPADGGGRALVDSSLPAEDCSTDADDDGDGAGGCDDAECFARERCVEAELTALGLDGWRPCGATVERSAEDMASRCEEGIPAGFDTPRELRCREVEMTARLQAYCPPGGGDERALRWSLSMDLSPRSERLGPSREQRTSYVSDFGFSEVYRMTGLAWGSGDPYPERVGYEGHETRAVGWESDLVAGARVVLFPAVESTTDVITYHEDERPDIVFGDPEMFLGGAFDVALE